MGEKSIQEILVRTKECFLLMSVAQSEAERREYRNEVVEMNIKLVPHILKKYQPYTEDMYQTACIGLIKAVDEYNVHRRVPFASFACLCIESELGNTWKKEQRTFESRLGKELEYFDAETTMGNGDTADKYDAIADPNAEAAFNRLFEAIGLDELFNEVINPVVEMYGTRSQGMDMMQWRKLEILYIFEMAHVDSSHRRLTFTAIAKELGTTTQNIRTRHSKVIEKVREALLQRGIRY